MDSQQACTTSGCPAEDFSLLPLGTRVTDRYRIERFLGRGGFAAVYAAVDELLGETVALKVFYRDLSLDKDRLLRIKREINLSRRISDSRVIKVFSLDRWREHWFLVMELVEGETLQQRLSREGKLSWPTLRPIFMEILAGMAALHAHHIVHRDIKPSNVMLARGGGVKILDFGLAKKSGDPERSAKLNEVVGTPLYLSPEQLQGLAVDVRSDVFQLGLLLLTVLQGKPPLQGMDTLSILVQRMGRIPVSIDLDGLCVPGPVRLGLEKALRRRPLRRFADAGDMLAYFSVPDTGWNLMLARLERMAPYAALLLVLGIAAGVWWLAAKRPALPDRVQVEQSRLSLLDKKGDPTWTKDFAPRLVYRAELQRCNPPLQRYRSNLKARYLVYAFLSSLTGLDYRSQPTLGDTSGDGRMLQILPDGAVLVDQSLSSLIRAGDYGFIPRAYVLKYEKSDLNGDGSAEIIVNIGQSRGMFPNALLLIADGHLFRLVSPGAIDGWTISTGSHGSWRFTLHGVGNRMGHLNFCARVDMSTEATPGGLIKLIPHLEDNRRGFGMEPEWLVYFPRGFHMPANTRLPSRGPVELVNLKGDRLQIEDDGTLRWVAGQVERVFHDPPLRLNAVYRDIHFAMQARDLRNDVEAAARLLASASATEVENPWLRAVIAYLAGDIEVRRGRYAAGRRQLRRALALHPGLNDAAHRLLEAVLLKDGPRHTLRLMDEPDFAEYKGFWGLACGRDFFKNLCLLMAGDFEEARLFSLRLGQEAAQNAALLDSLIDLLQGKDITQDIPRDNTDMSLLYTWEEYRLLEGRARMLAGDESARAEFCFRDVRSYSRLRRHLTDMSTAWFVLKKGRKEEAALMARRAFDDLAARSRGDLETRFWWFYDAWVFGRIMEELGENVEARRGYAACIAANPHSALAERARLRLAGL